MKRLGIAALALFLGIGAALGGWWLRAHTSSSEAAPGLIGQPAPALEFKDLDGKAFQLSQWRGKLLLVNFWAGWCAPCVDEIPLLVAAQKQYGAQGLQVVGPAMDDVESVKPAVAKLGINYPIAANFEQVDAAMRQLGNPQGALPYTVLIARDGRIAKTILGGLHKDELELLIETYLEVTPPSS